MPQQLVGVRDADRLVAHTGEEQHLVRSPRGDQRAREAHGVRWVNVVVSQSVDQQQRPRQLWRASTSELDSYR